MRPRPGGGLDTAVGVLNAKDLLAAQHQHRHHGGEVDLRTLARPLPRVAEGMRADELLREMRRQRRHLALVVDEHGTVTGLGLSRRRRPLVRRTRAVPDR